MKNNFEQKLRKQISVKNKIPLTFLKKRDIKRFLRKIPNISWSPDYLFEDTQNNKYLAFTVIYDAEFYPNVLSKQVKKAIKKCPFDFFFIIENESLLDLFEENCRENEFGLVLNKQGIPILIRDAVKSVIPPKISQKYAGHFNLWVINQIPNLNLGNLKFKTVLNDFSKGYIRLKNKKILDWQKEETLVKNTIAELLRSDNRYVFGVDSLDILSRFEKFWLDIRDHYFHSFHIFLLGLLILDHYKEEFISYHKNIFPKYQSSSIEFLWLLTSIFHDVGYPISKLNSLKENLYGVPVVRLEKEITNVWDDPIYSQNLRQLVSLFKFSYLDKKHKIDWYPEIFGIKDDNLKQVFRESFYDSHGVAGCFRFLVDIFSEASREEELERKIFLINHIYPAALSIALHDKVFRERLKQTGIEKLKLSRFPFAILLIYIDSIQEDRRDKLLCIEEPELIQGFEFNRKVILKINENIAKTYPRLGKLKAECIDFKNFVECDGIRFEYPDILLS